MKNRPKLWVNQGASALVFLFFFIFITIKEQKSDYLTCKTGSLNKILYTQQCDASKRGIYVASGVALFEYVILGYNSVNIWFYAISMCRSVGFLVVYIIYY